MLRRGIAASAAFCADSNQTAKDGYLQSIKKIFLISRTIPV
jgi:hypothetical protein